MMLHAIQSVTRDESKFVKTMLALAGVFAGALGAAVAIIAHV